MTQAESPIIQEPIGQSIHRRQVGSQLDAYLSALRRVPDLSVACYAKELDQQKTEVEKLRRDTTAQQMSRRVNGENYRTPFRLLTYHQAVR
jgi:hypothetical protein